MTALTMPNTDRRVREARRILFNATNRRQHKVAAQIEVARTNLARTRDAYERDEPDEATRLFRLAHLQLVWALTMTTNFDTCARIVDALVLIDPLTGRGDQ